MLEEGQSTQLGLTHHGGESDRHFPCRVRLDGEAASQRFVGATGCEEDIEVIEHQFVVHEDVELPLARTRVPNLSEVELHPVKSRNIKTRQRVGEVSIPLRSEDCGRHTGRDTSDCDRSGEGASAREAVVRQEGAGRDSSRVDGPEALQRPENRVVTDAVSVAIRPFQRIGREHVRVITKAVPIGVFPFG